MLTVLTIIFLALGVGLYIWNKFSPKDGYHEDQYTSADIARFVVGGISYVVGLGIFIALMCLIPKIATERTYDTRIEIVQESNTQVETQICSAVESYLKHEENVYEKLNVTTAIGLFSAYPNLKSNELVQSLIDTYRANADEIKELKMKKTSLSIYRFLVYFGK